MKKSGIKIISVLQILVMLVSIIIPAMFMCQTQVMAKNSLEDSIEQMESAKQLVTTRAEILSNRNKNMVRKEPI